MKVGASRRVLKTCSPSLVLDDYPPIPPRIAVCADPPADPGPRDAAAKHAEALGLPLLDRPGGGGFDMLLAVTPRRLELRVLRGPPGVAGGRPVTCDFSKIDIASSAGARLSQPLLRACAIRKGDPWRPSILDATAGWGGDAWLLAAAGCRVVAVERSGVVAAMLRDALSRAAVDHPAVARRVEVVHADALDLLRRRENGGGDGRGMDVAYLDPMFPAGRRRAAERKPMAVLRRLVGEDMDAAGLLEAAREAAGRRVVVKRPLKAPPLTAPPPTATHKGRSVRYDVYV